MISERSNQVFEQVIKDYHVFNNIDKVCENPFAPGTLDHLLYAKCWIDTAQWHMEDEVRDPEIVPAEALRWKRRIDSSNQARTDIVEDIDTYFLQQFSEIEPLPTARLNTESPAWAIDRLSILALKIYHMQEETTRANVADEQLKQRQNKLSILLQQRLDLSLSIDELIADIQSGLKLMRVYRQMKMYNDPELNPVLYNNKK